MNNKIVIVDQTEVILNNSKIIYFVIEDTTVSLNFRYKFVRDQDVNKNIITGIRLDATNLAADFYPKNINVGGVTLPVLFESDCRKAIINIVGKKNNRLLQDLPLTSFIDYRTLELKRFNLDIDLGLCYITFKQAPSLPAPFVIPFHFYWD